MAFLTFESSYLLAFQCPFYLFPYFMFILIVSFCFVSLCFTFFIYFVRNKFFFFVFFHFLLFSLLFAYCFIWFYYFLFSFVSISSRIVISGIPLHARFDDIEPLLKAYGKVEHCDAVSNKDPNTQTVHITYESIDQAQRYFLIRSGF